MTRKALVLVLIPVTLLSVSCGKSKEEYADAIRSAIAQDKVNTPQLGMWESIFGADQATIDRYVSSLRSINLDRCPSNFRDAYKKQIQAWQDYADTSRAGHSLDTARALVNESWYEVHHIAVEFGVSDSLKR